MADERTYKMLLGAIAGGGSGGLPDYSEASDGDVLAIENGEPAWAAPGGSILYVTNDDGTLDKTWQELYDAMAASVLCIAVYNISLEDLTNITFNVIQSVLVQEGSYKVVLDDGSLFIADTANDYPILD